MQMIPSAILKREYSETGETRWHNQKRPRQIYMHNLSGICLLQHLFQCFFMNMPIFLFFCFFQTRHVFFYFISFLYFFSLQYVLYTLSFSLVSLRHKCKIQTKMHETQPQFHLSLKHPGCCVIIFPCCFKIPNHGFKSSLCRLNLPLESFFQSCTVVVYLMRSKQSVTFAIYFL